ncbi:MAG: hypothetical protein M1358_01870, partial [Chloroflexi bacterium]|nr:hypothetical protein [Chloroflexota bacterium]
MSAKRGWRDSWAVVVAAATLNLFLLGNCGEQAISTPAQSTPSETDRAIAAAKQLYAEKKKEGMDFSNGLCLSNEVIPDWAVDIAHNPRQPVDDLPQNQCSSYREGKVR